MNDRIRLLLCALFRALATDVHPALEAGAGVMEVVHDSPPFPPVGRRKLPQQFG